MVGRPRQFDVDVAIDVATRLFTEKGYEGATFAELTSAMGISPPSFYAAFGSKEGLFMQVLERYVGGARIAIQQALAEPTARAVVEHLLQGFVNGVTAHPTARGCLLVQGALVSSDSSRHVRDYLRKEREVTTVALQRRFQQAVQANDKTLPGEPAVMALLTSMVMAGIAAQVASGSTREELIATAMKYVEFFE